MHSIELERITRAGPPSPDGFVVGKVLSVEPHPDADRLSVCEVDAGGGKRTIVCGAPNVAAGQTVPVALPGAVMPDGSELGKAKLRGVESDGMILSEAELQIGEDADGIVVLNGEGEPGTPLSEVLPVSETVLELEPTSNRVDCFGIYGVAREVHAATGAKLAPTAVGRGRRGKRRGQGRGLRLGHGRGPGALPSVHRAGLHRRDDRALAPVAEGAAARRRDAADQQRRRHHQLRDAAHRPAAARVRPRPGSRRRPDHQDREAGRDDDHPRRGRAQLRRRHGLGLRSRRSLRDRRDHGRPGLRGLRSDHPGAARGRDLERGQHPPHLAEARPPLRRLEPLREAAPSRARAPSAADRLER